MPRVLTGITTTGSPHLGNYVSAIEPGIRASRSAEVQAYYFLADYHALIKCRDPEAVRRATREIACTWLALGLDPERTLFYRQSDLPEVAELTWILACSCAKGLLNRAHAYKAAVQVNLDQEREADAGISLGLFGYPVLMAADILLFRAEQVPVGGDQIQHVEMARDIAGRFNHEYGPLFVLPEARVTDQTKLLPGLDGRKMSKSYGNTIDLFLPPKRLLAAVRKIKTNLQEPGEPKDPDESALFQVWQAFADPEQTQAMRAEFAAGIAWGEVKNRLFELLEQRLAEPRARYEELMSEPARVERVLEAGAERARAEARPLLAAVRHAVGIRRLTDGD